MSDERRADIAFWIAIAAGLAFVLFLGPLERRLEMAYDNDFAGFWAHGRAVLLGANVYDAEQWRRVAPQLAYVTRTQQMSVPSYFPWATIFIALFALLPIELAAWVWMVVGIAAATFGLRALLRAFVPGRAAMHAAFGASLFLSQPGYHAIVLGQWSPLLLGALCAIVLALRGGPPWAAALPVPLLLMKPQLFVWTGLGLLYAAPRSRAVRRALPLAIALAVATVAIGWLAFPGWLGGWTAEIPAARTARSAVLSSALGQLIGPPGVIVAYVLIVVAALVVARLPAGSDRSLAAWLALSGAGAIYSWSYDYLLLLVPLVMTAGVLVGRHDDRGARRLALATAAFGILVTPLFYALAVARHDETFSVVIPIVAFLAVLLLVRERAPEQVEPA